MLRNDEGCIIKFKDIPQILTEIGIKKLYRKDELLIAQGMEVDGLYVITKGKVMCTTYSENGKKKIHAILDVYSTFGVGHSMNLFEAPFDFICFSQVEVIFIEKRKVIDLLKTDLEATLFLIKTDTFVLNNFCYQLSKKTFYNSGHEICNMLVNFAKYYGVEEGNKIKLNFDLSVQFICEFVGVNKLTVNRTFKKLKDENLIEKKDGYYYINNLNKLKKYIELEYTM